MQAATRPPSFRLMARNNFDGVRIGLALMVLLAHLAVLTQRPELQPLRAFFDPNFAVRGFFAISGFLVTRSYLGSQNIWVYLEKRLRRIYPAYVATVALCLGVGASVTALSLSDFFASPQTLRYLWSNLAFLNFLQPSLPAVFESHPVRAMNGSLWTIKVEVMLYLCMPALVGLFRRFGATRAALGICLLSLAWTYAFENLYGGPRGAELARQFPGQLAYFTLGALFAVNDALLARIRWIALVGALAWLATDHPQARLIVDPVTCAAVTLWLCTSALPNLRLGRCGDLSYGVYLYHFPLIQLLIALGTFDTHPWIGAAAALALTLAAALASWHLIEKRLLRRTSPEARAAGA